MPRNKQESLIFTLCMCSLMVFGMSAYNTFLHGELSVSAVAKGFPLGFIVAFILDVFVVGDVAKKVAFKLPLNKEKQWQIGIAISCCMIIGMVSFMSLFGLIMNAGIGHLSFADYFKGWGLNFIVALPLQLLIVRPISVLILGFFQKEPVAE